MTTIRGFKLRWLHQTFDDVTYEFGRLQLSPMGPLRWRPAINAFQCDKGLRICVDLAGVDRSEVELTVEAQRVVVSGIRSAPEPANHEEPALQMFAFEIDYGPFERVVELPVPVDVSRAKAEQRNGLLWIELPIKK